jgi:hypothetical protein
MSRGLLHELGVDAETAGGVDDDVSCCRALGVLDAVAATFTGSP